MAVSGPAAVATATCPALDKKINLTNICGHVSETNKPPAKRHRIGYWWSEKKSQKLNANELANLFNQRQCDLVKLDLERPFEEQGPFSIIVHKLSDYVVKAGLGDALAKQIIKSFESYCRKHPETVILDPLDNIRFLLDRYQQYRMIAESQLSKGGFLFTPPFVHLTSTNIDVNRGRIKRSKITFPIVCKPILAQGSQEAHQMCIIFSEAGLNDIKPPCVAQSFVNHNAKLFKLFVIKDKYYVIERPSLKNFQAGDHETVFFFSHDISKTNSCSSLTELDDEDKIKLSELIKSMRGIDNLSDDDDGDQQQERQYHSHEQQHRDDKEATKRKKTDVTTTTTGNTNGTSINSNGNDHKMPTNELASQQHQFQNCSPLMPSRQKLEKIVKAFSERLGLTFYGLDIIIENESSRFAIIDMNTFPGYDGVDNFPTLFRDVVCDAIPKQQDSSDLQQTQTSKVNKRKPKEFDSGIEST